MRRRFLILFLLLVIILPLKVKALSISKSNLTMDKGERQTVELYADVDETIDEISFSLVYTTYDIPAYFNIESGLTDSPSGITHKITFAEPVSGKVKLGEIRINVVNNPKDTAGSINIHSASAVTTDGEKVKLTSQMINVKVNQTVEPNTTVDEPKDDEEKTNLLSKIESELVDIELKKDVYEYTVNVKENIDELDLNPVAIDDSYEVTVSSQKISELVDSQIVITVKDGDNIEEYKIHVNVIEDVDIEIDKNVFESVYKYKGKWVFLIIVFGVALFAGLFLTKKQ